MFKSCLRHPHPYHFPHILPKNKKLLRNNLKKISRNNLYIEKPFKTMVANSKSGQRTLIGSLKNISN